MVMLMYDRESHYTNRDGTTSAEAHTPRNYKLIELKLDQGEHIGLASNVAYLHALQNLSETKSDVPSISWGEIHMHSSRNVWWIACQGRATRRSGCIINTQPTGLLPPPSSKNHCRQIVH